MVDNQADLDLDNLGDHKQSGMNYICIKQNIVTRNKTLLISDRAFKIKAIKEMLEKEKIQFEVVPEFKY